MLQPAKDLILMGAALLVVGCLMLLSHRLGVGRLPFDFTWRGKNITVHFPLATSLLISLVLTLLLNFWLGKQR
jgi:DUF2905 family protein